MLSRAFCERGGTARDLNSRAATHPIVSKCTKSEKTSNGFLDTHIGPQIQSAFVASCDDLQALWQSHVTL